MMFGQDIDNIRRENTGGSLLVIDVTRLDT